MKLEDRLNKMFSKTFMYNAIHHKVLSFRITEVDVTIVTDKKWITVPLTKINAELEQFLPVADESGEDFTKAVTVMSSDNKQSFKDIVSANIKSLQASPGYIPQAKAINEQIKTMILMAKLEVDIIKMKNQK